MRKFSLGILALFLAVLLQRFVPSAVSLFIPELAPQDAVILDKGLDIIVWAAGTLLVCLIIRLLLWRLIVKRATKGNTPELIKQLLDFIIVIISIVVASKVLFGQNVVAAVTALGALGIVISFGIKDLIQDLMTGLAINLELSFAIGDWVSVQDGQVGRIFGQVVQINWRTTHIVDDNQRYYIVPNREIGNSTITVLSNPTSLTRDEVKVDMDYTIPVADAKRILMTSVMSVLEEYGFSEHPHPDVLVSGFPASGIEYTIRYWIYIWEQIAPAVAKDHVLAAVMRNLRLNGLSPAFSKLEHFSVDPPDLLNPPDLTKGMQQMITKLGIFEAMTIDENDFVAEQGKMKDWATGDIILKQGKKGESMFVMLNGLVKAYVTDKHGEEMYVGQIQSGEMFGEMSLLTGEPRSATIKAVTPVTTLEITQDILEKLLQKRPALGERLSEMMATRQRKSADIVAQSHVDETQTLKTAIYGKMRKIFKLP